MQRRVNRAPPKNLTKITLTDEDGFEKKANKSDSNQSRSPAHASGPQEKLIETLK